MKTLEEMYSIFDDYLQGMLSKENLRWFLREYHSNTEFRTEFDTYRLIVSFLKEKLHNHSDARDALNPGLLKSLVDEALQNPEWNARFSPSRLREKGLKQLSGKELTTTRSIISGTDGINFDLECISPVADEVSLTGCVVFRFISNSDQDYLTRLSLHGLVLKIFDNVNITEVTPTGSMVFESNAFYIIHRLSPGLYYWYLMVKDTVLFSGRIYVLPFELLRKALSF